MYLGRLKKVSSGAVTQGNFSMLPKVGRAFKVDNDGPMGGEITSNVTEVIETTATNCEFKTVDAHYKLEFVVEQREDRTI